jgi:hypothetical protein
MTFFYANISILTSFVNLIIVQHALHEIIVHHVYVPVSTSRHMLHYLLTKVIKRYRDLHPIVRVVR